MQNFMRHFMRAVANARSEDLDCSDKDINDEAEAKDDYDEEESIAECFDYDDRIPEFADGASNVYRTKYFIVRQRLAYSSSEVFGGLLCSHDTFFERTKERDKEYDAYFCDRLNLDGKRIPTLMYTREYIE